MALEPDGVRPTYDTHTTWHIYCLDGTLLKLKCNTDLCGRFPYLDIQEHKASVTMVQTVHQNYEGYTKRQVQEAILAHKAQATLENPSQKDFLKMVSSSLGV